MSRDFHETKRSSRFLVASRKPAPLTPARTTALLSELSAAWSLALSSRPTLLKRPMTPCGLLAGHFIRYSSDDAPMRQFLELSIEPISISSLHDHRLVEHNSWTYRGAATKAMRRADIEGLFASRPKRLRTDAEVNVARQLANSESAVMNLPPAVRGISGTLSKSIKTSAPRIS